LGVGRPGGCEGEDGYQGDADELAWHKTLHKEITSKSLSLASLEDARPRLRQEAPSQ
jgi:hypothetical protein